jgi:predicted TIM-barrel enzyme
MAEVMAIPIGTARGRLQRARARLEEEMQRLADSPRDLASTVARLDDWAAECREHLDSYRVDAVLASGATARRPASV